MKKTFLNFCCLLFFSSSVASAEEHDSILNAITVALVDRCGVEATYYVIVERTDGWTEEGDLVFDWRHAFTNILRKNAQAMMFINKEGQQEARILQCGNLAFND